MRFILALLLMFAAALSLNAKNNPETNPVINPYGKITPYKHAAYMPDKSKPEHKIVFTLTKAPDSPDKINPSLNYVAKIINLYASAGISPDRLKIVAVASGGATPLALTNAAYRKKFGTDNPNEDLIKQLKKAGAEISVCGQAWAADGYKPQDLNPEVSESFSALTTAVILQEKGYSLIPK